MPQYKLVYFDGRGRGEVSRWLFALAGVPYEDVRYGHDNGEWEKVKQSVNAPFGQLPCLSVDGTLYCQSLCIAKYLAETFGYGGKTDTDRLRADMIAHCCEDMATAIFNATFSDDEKTKETLSKKLKDEGLKTYFTNLENILKQNKGDDGFFVGDSLTWADLTFAHYVEFITPLGYEENAFLSSYPKLRALREKVLKLPKVAEWIAKRPNTPW